MKPAVDADGGGVDDGRLASSTPKLQQSASRDPWRHRNLDVLCAPLLAGSTRPNGRRGSKSNQQGAAKDHATAVFSRTSIARIQQSSALGAKRHRSVCFLDCTMVFHRQPTVLTPLGRFCPQVPTHVGNPHGNRRPAVPAPPSSTQVPSQAVSHCAPGGLRSGPASTPLVIPSPRLLGWVVCSKVVHATSCPFLSLQLCREARRSRLGARESSLPALDCYV